MLWEQDDPATALSERFGFADVTAVVDWVSMTLQHYWQIEVVCCERIVMSFKNALVWIQTPHGRMLVKWSIMTPWFPRLAVLADITAWLDRCGLPVSAPVPTTEGQRQVEVDGVSISLQRHVDGELLEFTDVRQVSAAGVTLARLHDALSSYPDAERVAVLEQQSETLAARITGWLATEHPRAPAAALEVLRRQLAAAPAAALPTQLVHGDFRAANILMTGEDVAAVLDFEEARLDHRIAELARSAVLLGTRYHDWGPVTPAVHAAFLDGYQSVCRLTAAEAAWWDTLVLWFSLAMIPAGDDPTGWGAAVDLLTRQSRSG